MTQYVRWRQCLLLVVMMLWALPLRAEETTETVGPAPGERLQFNLSWMGIPGGRAEMRYTKPEADTYSIETTLDSIGAVRFMYLVEDRLEANGMVTPQGLLSRTYLKLQNEGSRNRRTDYFFNRDLQQVLITINNGHPKRFDEMGPDVNDPITAWYALRFHNDVRPGAILNMPILDGTKRYVADVFIGEQERMATPLGFFDVLPVRPQLEHSDLFRHQGNLVVYVTNDARRMPVRVEAKVKVGSVVADLVSYDDGKGGHQEIQLEKR
ncbi:MAG: DUF3108 domain-containing protein [Magnetococcales bacterium]|nr:DUF3108 domain-containing protein [Magnetococcales bacterium]